MVSWLLVMGGLGAVSNLKPDERIVFFPGVGHFNHDGTWRVRVRGWVFEPEQDSRSRGRLLEALRASLGLEAGDVESAVFRKRAAAFLVDNERGKRIVIQLGSQRFALPASETNGHFEGECTLSPGSAPPPDPSGGPSWISFRAVLPDGDTRIMEGRVMLLPPAGLSVISDIDDTIKISDVRNKRNLLTHTFLLPFEFTPGMPEFYRRLALFPAAFHYVSASPWHLFEPLDEFRGEAGYPPGMFHLLDFRWKDTTFFNLLAEPEEKKMPALEAILRDWPGRRFILIGDSGEKDPEIYGDLASRRPEQVQWILIRDVTGEGPESSRMQAAFDGVPRERWIIFQHPDELRDRLRP